MTCVHHYVLDKLCGTVYRRVDPERMFGDSVFQGSRRFNQKRRSRPGELAQMYRENADAVRSAMTAIGGR